MAKAKRSTDEIIKAIEHSIDDDLPALLRALKDLALGHQAQKIDARTGDTTVYWVSPDRAALVYMLDRVAGKPTERVEQRTEGTLKVTLALSERTIANKPVPISQVIEAMAKAPDAIASRRAPTEPPEPPEPKALPPIRNMTNANRPITLDEDDMQDLDDALLGAFTPTVTPASSHPSTPTTRGRTEPASSDLPNTRGRPKIKVRRPA